MAKEKTGGIPKTKAEPGPAPSIGTILGISHTRETIAHRIQSGENFVRSVI